MRPVFVERRRGSGVELVQNFHVARIALLRGAPLALALRGRGILAVAVPLALDAGVIFAEWRADGALHIGGALDALAAVGLAMRRRGPGAVRVGETLDAARSGEVAAAASGRALRVGAAAGPAREVAIADRLRGGAVGVREALDALAVARGALGLGCAAVGALGALHALTAYRVADGLTLVGRAIGGDQAALALAGRGVAELRAVRTIARVGACRMALVVARPASRRASPAVGVRAALDAVAA